MVYSTLTCPVTVLNMYAVDYIFIYLKEGIYSIKKGIIIGMFFCDLHILLYGIIIEMCIGNADMS